MELPINKVCQILQDEGVKHLYHANSVLTACQFLREGALLSRGIIERRKRYQTDQYSDGIDQQYSLWNDVFTDSVDIHKRSARRNFYGPVLFVLDLQILKHVDARHVWVTKLNPTKWDGRPREDRWFVSTRDLKNNFHPGDFNQMIVFRHCGEEIPLSGFLKELIVDDPKIKGTGALGVDYFSAGCGALRLAITEGPLEIKLTRRTCERRCQCVREYESHPVKARKMFIPKL